MCKRINTECCLLDETSSNDAGIDQTSPPVAPTYSSNTHGKHPCRDQETLTICIMSGHFSLMCTFVSTLTVLVLPDNDRISIQIGNIRPSNLPRILLQYHPSQMRMEEAFQRAIRILGCICPPMMSPMFAAPEANRALNRASPYKCEKQPKR